jgi:ABC-type uncharacterized transport system involved in gliding motility auxiliary subunit
MKTSPRLRLEMMAQNALFALLLVAAAALAVYLLKDSKLQRDITLNQRNTLSQGTLEVLRKMNGPIAITAYATPTDAALGDLHKLIQEFVAPYQRAKPDLTLAFVDPREQPKALQAANIRTNGELVIEFGGRSEHLTNLNEQNMANLLMRLARSGERVVMYVDGHGEPKLDGRANFDLGDFGQQLGNKGFKVQGLNLAVAPDVPANCAVLIVTPPRTALLKGEVDKIQRWLEGGGSLLWLIDQEPLRGLEPIAEYLHLRLTPGIVVDPAAARLGVPATIALSANYGFHAITEQINAYNTAFPSVRQIEVDPENKDWQTASLVEVAQGGWVEIGDPEKDLRFDRDRELRGPVTVAIAMERNVKDKSQRIVVVGGASFLSNTFVGMLANLDLGINMLNWLSVDENLIALQPRARVDSELKLGRPALYAIGLGFLLFLPLLFLSLGGTIWWRRRKAR